MAIFRQQFFACYLKHTTADKEDNCPICQEAFDDSTGHGAMTYSDPKTCKHIFGESCLRRWLSVECGANTCALCRRELFSKKLDWMTDIDLPYYLNDDEVTSVTPSQVAEIFERFRTAVRGHLHMYFEFLARSGDERDHYGFIWDVTRRQIPRPEADFFTIVRDVVGLDFSSYERLLDFEFDDIYQEILKATRDQNWTGEKETLARDDLEEYLNRGLYF